MGKSKRESNFELLRIVAMILIIVYHVFFHCINNQVLSKDMYAPGELFNNPILYKRLAVTEIATTFGKIGNNLFLIISGYFLIDKKIDIKKISKKLLSEMFFITVILTVVSFFYVQLTNSSAGITFRYFNSGWWFIGYYIIVILIARFVLNRFIERMGAREYITTMLVLFALVSVQYIRNMLKDISEVIPMAVIGVFMYLAGGFIKLYNPFKKTKTIFLIFTIILVNLFLFMSYCININNLLNGNNASFHQAIYSYEEYAIPCVIISICLFELFRRLRLPGSGTINFIASSTFMIYLIHDNPLSRNLFFKIKWVKLLYDQDYGGFALMLLAVIVIAFVSGIILSFIYHLLSKLVQKIVNSQIDVQ